MMECEPIKPENTDSDSPESLARACVDGDSSARETLARWCLPRVRRTVYMSCGNSADVDDIVQIAMARLFSRLDSFRGEARFYVWADRVTMNVVRDHFRRRRFVFLTERGDFEEQDFRQDKDGPAIDSPEKSAEQRRLLSRLSDLFAKMREKRRLPLVLSLLHGYSIPEIAAMLDIGQEAAKKRLLRGRRELLRRLREDSYCWELLKEMKL